MNSKKEVCFPYQKTAILSERNTAGKHVDAFHLMYMAKISTVNPLGNIRAGTDGFTVL